jgi:hypothetical protein
MTFHPSKAPRTTLLALGLLLLVTRIWFGLGSSEELVLRGELSAGVTWAWLDGGRLPGFDRGLVRSIERIRGQNSLYTLHSLRVMGMGD